MNKTKIKEFKEVKRFEKELDACMKCGFCSFWCPVFQEEKQEASVARGKMALIKSILAGELEHTSAYSTRINKCTLCKRCTTNCPSKVKTSDVIVAARADKTKAKGVPFPTNIVYKWLIPHRLVFGSLVRIMSWLQRIFLTRHDGTVRHIALFFPAMLKGRDIPRIAPKFFRQIIPEKNLPKIKNERNLTVGYFTGCMTDFVFPETGRKIVNFLNNNGVQVNVPRAQGCCGAPVFLGAGDFEIGRKIADDNVRAFQDVDIVIADCATCSSSIKDYAKFLADTPERMESYTKFAEKVMDISVFLVDVLKLPASAYQVLPEFKGKIITWHDPCHLIRHQGVRDQPRQILKSIPDIEYIELPDADRCCGMAGGFSLYYYDLSKKIAAKKMDAIRSSKADILVTGCPGCITQLRDTVQRHNNSTKILHIMDILK